MTLSINITTTEDIRFEVALTLSPTSNYSDGVDKGFRPAIYWALVKMPSTVIRSGMFSIKDEPVTSTSSESVARARTLLLDDPDCICKDVVDYMLETYEREP